jgi:membrane glycosyltransferase
VTAAPDMIAWLLPIAGPMIISPVLIWATSSNAEGGKLRFLFLTPTEVHAAPVMIVREQILKEWQRTGIERLLVEAQPMLVSVPASQTRLEV